jgi:hypothetical protein
MIKRILNIPSEAISTLLWKTLKKVISGNQSSPSSQDINPKWLQDFAKKNPKHGIEIEYSAQDRVSKYKIIPPSQ